MKKSLYLDIYERLCPRDPIADDDPRRESVILEMRAVCKSPSPKEAASIVAWWSVDSDWREKRAADFVRKVRRLYRGLSK